MNERTFSSEKETTFTFSDRVNLNYDFTAQVPLSQIWKNFESLDEWKESLKPKLCRKRGIEWEFVLTRIQDCSRTHEWGFRRKFDTRVDIIIYEGKTWNHVFFSTKWVASSYHSVQLQLGKWRRHVLPQTNQKLLIWFPRTVVHLWGWRIIFFFIFTRFQPRQNIHRGKPHASYLTSLWIALFFP